MPSDARWEHATSSLGSKLFELLHPLLGCLFPHRFNLPFSATRPTQPQITQARSSDWCELAPGMDVLSSGVNSLGSGVASLGNAVGSAAQAAHSGVTSIGSQALAHGGRELNALLDAVAVFTESEEEAAKRKGPTPTMLEAIVVGFLCGLPPHPR